MSKYEFKWWVSLFFMAALIVGVGCMIWGCDDTTSPEVRYLGPPIVQAMNATGNARRLDAWALSQDDYPVFAAFGWRVSYQWAGTEVDYTEPGIHTTIAIMNCSSPGWSPVLRRSVTGSGCNSVGNPKSITAVSGNDGITNFYLSLHDWPYMDDVANNINVGFHANGMPDDACAVRAGSFGQDKAAFYAKGGAWQNSYQDWPFLANSKASLPTSPPMPDFVPMDLEPIMSPPRVPIADILPTEAECRASNPPPYNYSDTDGGDFIIHSQWMKLRLAGGDWVLELVDFITAIPCDANSVVSVANTAWPYSVSFHAPAESAGLGVVDAELAIIDPNGEPNGSIAIKIHEVGRCVSCTEWVWRSDYVLPVTGSVTGSMADLLKVETASGPVLVAWLPRGYNLKIDPSINARTVYILSRVWLAGDSILDLDGDGVVNFNDYGILLGMK